MSFFDMVVINVTFRNCKNIQQNIQRTFDLLMAKLPNTLHYKSKTEILYLYPVTLIIMNKYE